MTSRHSGSDWATPRAVATKDYTDGQTPKKRKPNYTEVIVIDEETNQPQDLGPDLGPDLGLTTTSLAPVTQRNTPSVKTTPQDTVNLDHTQQNSPSVATQQTSPCSEAPKMSREKVLKRKQDTERAPISIDHPGLGFTGVVHRPLKSQRRTWEPLARSNFAGSSEQLPTKHDQIYMNMGHSTQVSISKGGLSTQPTQTIAQFSGPSARNESSDTRSPTPAVKLQQRGSCSEGDQEVNYPAAPPLFPSRKKKNKRKKKVRESHVLPKGDRQSMCDYKTHQVRPTCLKITKIPSDKALPLSKRELRFGQQSSSTTLCSVQSSIRPLEGSSAPTSLSTSERPSTTKQTEVSSAPTSLSTSERPSTTKQTEVSSAPTTLSTSERPSTTKQTEGSSAPTSLSTSERPNTTEQPKVTSAPTTLLTSGRPTTTKQTEVSSAPTTLLTSGRPTTTKQTEVSSAPTTLLTSGRPTTTKQTEVSSAPTTLLTSGRPSTTKQTEVLSAPTSLFLQYEYRTEHLRKKKKKKKGKQGKVREQTATKSQLDSDLLESPVAKKLSVHRSSPLDSDQIIERQPQPVEWPATGQLVGGQSSVVKHKSVESKKQLKAIAHQNPSSKSAVVSNHVKSQSGKQESEQRPKSLKQVNSQVTPTQSESPESCTSSQQQNQSSPVPEHAGQQTVSVTRPVTPTKAVKSQLSSPKSILETCPPGKSASPATHIDILRGNTSAEPNRQQQQISSSAKTTSSCQSSVPVQQTSKRPYDHQTSMSTSERPNTTKQPKMSSAPTSLSTSDRSNTTKQPKVTSAPTFLSTSDRSNTTKQPEASSALSTSGTEHARLKKEKKKKKTERKEKVRVQTASKSQLDSHLRESPVAKKLSVNRSSLLDSDHFISQPMAKPEREPQPVKWPPTGQLVGDESPVVKHKSVERKKQLNAIVHQNPPSKSAVVSDQVKSQSGKHESEHRPKRLTGIEQSLKQVNSQVTLKSILEICPTGKSESTATHILRGNTSAAPNRQQQRISSSVMTTSSCQSSVRVQQTSKRPYDHQTSMSTSEIPNPTEQPKVSSAPTSLLTSDRPHTTIQPEASSALSTSGTEHAREKKKKKKKKTEKKEKVREQTVSKSQLDSDLMESAVAKNEPSTMRARKLDRKSRRLCAKPLKSSLRHAARSPFSSLHTVPSQASRSHALPKRYGQCIFPWKSHSASQQEASDINARKASLEVALLSQRSLDFDQQSGSTTQFSVQSAIPPLEVASAQISISTKETHINTKQPEVSSAQTSLSTNTTKQPEVSSAHTLSTSERPNTTIPPEMSSAQTSLSSNTTQQPEVSSAHTSLSTSERPNTNKRPNTTQQPEVSSALISMSSSECTNTPKQPEVSSALISMSTSECTNTTQQPEVSSAQTSLPSNERPNNTKQPEARRETETTEKPEAEKCKSMKLDEDQLTVLEKWKEKCLLINAGPGAGKTLVLCELVRKIFSEKRGARVLVLAFNLYAVAELKSRLETRYPDIPVVADDEKDRLFCSSHCGCLVSTFHSFAFQSSGKTYQFKDKMYAPEFEENVSILKAKRQDCLARRWDWVIVDEAQDVNKPRGDLIDVLRETCGHLMLAGDPRQSIDQESTWFANIWRGDCDNTGAVKATLRYNHRSTRRIVEFLNQYSQHNFSDCGLHIDQQCLRETGVQTRLGEGILEPHDKEKHGDVIANYLLQAPDPDDAYAIVPVTFDKYNLDDISRDIESTIRSNGHTTKRIKSLEKVNASVIKTKGCKKKEKSPYLIGSVCSLKGTEKARVVVYGVSRSYNPKVKDDLLARRVYVAMSRAREHLHVITNPKLTNKNPLMKLINSRSAPDRSHSDWEYKLTVSDLAKEKCAFWPHKHGLSEYLGCDKPRDVQQLHLVSPGDERLLGEYMESVLAFCLGFKDAGPDFSTPTENDVKLQFEKDTATNPCLAVVRALRSKSERKLYTAGEHLLSGWSQHKRHCQPFASFIRGHMGGSCEYQKDLEVPIRPHRSSKQVGVLRGRADFAGDNEIVEVKYVDKLSEEHSLQAAIYCAMHAALPGAGSKEALLINLKDGSIKTVNDVSPKHLQDLARAKLALMNARCTKDESSREGHHVAVAAIKTDIGQVVELGAVAFTLTGDVYGTYHRVLTGVSDVSSSDTLDGQRTQISNSNDTQDSNLAQAGLRIDRPELLKNQEMECGLLRDHFNMWVNSIPDRQDFVYWDSSVCRDLGMGGSMVNLGDRMAANSSVSLEDCVDRNLGRDWVYEPHRAYENAVAVAALFVNHTFSRVRLDHLQRLYNCKRTVRKGQKQNERPTKKAQV